MILRGAGETVAIAGGARGRRAVIPDHSCFHGKTCHRVTEKYETGQAAHSTRYQLEKSRTCDPLLSAPCRFGLSGSGLRPRLYAARHTPCKRGFDERERCVSV